MDTWWPWLAVAGAGALHGLNPAAGWVLVAGCGLHARGRAFAWRALVPIGAGHLVSMGLVSAAVVSGRPIDRATWAVLASVLILGGVARVVWRRARPGVAQGVSPAGLALASGVLSTAQGAGLMLVPGLMPVCAPGVAGGGAGDAAVAALWTTLAAAAVHTVAMLLAAGAAARLAGRVMRRLLAWRLRPSTRTA